MNEIIHFLYYPFFLAAWGIVFDKLQYSGELLGWLPQVRHQIIVKLGVKEESVLYEFLDKWSGGCHICHASFLAMALYPFFFEFSALLLFQLVTLTAFFSYKMA
jgi:hypothetical protein